MFLRHKERKRQAAIRKEEAIQHSKLYPMLPPSNYIIPREPLANITQHFRTL